MTSTTTPDELDQPEAPEDPGHIDFAVYDDETGQVMRSGYMPTVEMALMQAGEGESVFIGQVAAGHYIDSGAAVPMGDAPSDDHVFDWATHTWELRSMPEMRAAASARIDAAYSEATVAISAGYPLEERESWPVQTSEARALVADPDAVTPWINAAASARGLSPADLAQRIILLDNAYRAVHGYLSGTRQQLQRQVAAATTPQELALAVWPNIEGIS